MTSLAGSFLVARPVLQDPHFRESVVLMIQHTQDGAFGLVVNRPAPVEGAPFPVYMGGPCEAEGLLMLHGHPEWLSSEEEAEQREVAPGVFLGDAECVDRVTEADDAEELRYRIIVGYAGWGPDQLERELVGSAWHITSASGEALFDTPAEELWSHLAPPVFPNPSNN